MLLFKTALLIVVMMVAGYYIRQGVEHWGVWFGILGGLACLVIALAQDYQAGHWPPRLYREKRPPREPPRE